MATPKNVANPKLYAKAKAKAKNKFDVYPSAYANGYMVQEYKRMGGKYKGATGGEVTLNEKKSDLDNDGKLSRYERKRGQAIAKQHEPWRNRDGSRTRLRSYNGKQTQKDANSKCVRSVG